MNEKVQSETPMRCQLVKVKNIEGNLSFMEDLQKDFDKFFETIYFWLGIGYGIVDENSQISYIEPDESIKLRNNKLGDNVEIVSRFINMYTKKGTGSSSSYGIFCSGYKPAKKAKLTDKIKETLSTIKNISEKDWNSDTFPEKSELSIWKSKFTKEEWSILRNQIIENDNLQNIWEKIGYKFVDSNRALAVDIRKIIGNCSHPSNNAYCRILNNMLKSQIKSQKEKYEIHLKETENLKLEFEKKNTDKELFDTFNNYLK